MARSINFVGERRKRLTEAQKKDQKAMKVSINVLVGVFALFLIVIGARFFFMFQVKSIKDTQLAVRTRILSNEQVEKEYILFAQKLKKLSVFFGRRKDKQEALVFFSEVFGSDVIVSGIDYSSAEEDVVSFVIKAPNIFVMERVFNTLEEATVTDTYPNIQKSSMRRSATGNYTVNLAVILTQEAISGEAPQPQFNPETQRVNTTN